MGERYNRNDHPLAVFGVIPGSMANRVLLALRAGAMESETLYARLPGCSEAIRSLLAAGLVVRISLHGRHGSRYQITRDGMQLVTAGGPLCYRAMPVVLPYADTVSFEQSSLRRSS